MTTLEVLVALHLLREISHSRAQHPRLESLATLLPHLNRNITRPAHFSPLPLRLPGTHLRRKRFHLRNPPNGQHEGRVRALDDLLEGQHHAPRPVELEVGGRGRAVLLQQPAEEAHEPGAELDQLQAAVDHEVPGEGLAEGRDAHLEAADRGGGRAAQLERSVDAVLRVVGLDFVSGIEEIPAVSVDVPKKNCIYASPPLGLVRVLKKFQARVVKFTFKTNRKKVTEGQ